MAELIASFLAGLALFFYGVAGIKKHLQGVTSRRVRKQLIRWAEVPLAAGFWGFGFGAITQSATAVAFILTGLAEAGLLSVAHALPIVAWANLGTVVLVFFASFNLKVVYLYLLGVAGIAHAFEIGGSRLRPVIAALFSIGLLFYGLFLMKGAFGPLSDYPWFQDVTDFIHSSTFALFIAGAILRVLTQSSSSIAVIAVALAHGGVLTLEQAVVMAYGSGLGVGLSIVFLASNLRGIPKRLTLYQAGINTFSATLLTSLFYIETLFDVPLLLHLTDQLTDNASLRLAFAYLFLQTSSVSVSLLIAKPAARWLERWVPATDEQDLIRPQYLADQALNDPDSALRLAAKEQLRLLKRLPSQLDSIRAEAADRKTIPAAVIHRATQTVGQEIEAYLNELASRETDGETSERLLISERQQSNLDALNDSVFQFVTTGAELQRDPDQSPTLVNQLVESLATLLLSAIDAEESEDTLDIQLLFDMTADRAALMERTRGSLLSQQGALTQQQKSQVTYLTALFERIVWLLRQLSQIQKAKHALDNQSS